MEKGNNDDIPFPHQHPPANATRRTKSNRQRENNQMFDLSNGWRVCFICVLSVAFPKFGQRSTAHRPSVCRIYYGRQNTQHTHKSNHNIVAIYTQGNQNTTKQQQAMGSGSSQFNRLIHLRELIALFTA